MRCARGQATLEYVAVVALVAAVLVAGAVLAGGADLARAVHAGMVRALCVASGGGLCGADLEPCPTGWRRDGRTWGVTVSLVRFGGESFVLREPRSDGTVAVTFGQDGSGRVEVGAGRRIGVVDAEVRAAAMTAAGRGATWVLPDAAAADAFLRRTAAWQRGEGGREPDAGPADVTYEQRGPGVEASAQAVLGALGVTGSVARGAVQGVRRDRATGRATFYLERRTTVVRALRGVGAGRRAGVEGGASDAEEAGEQLAVVVDARRRPVELQIVRTQLGGAVPAGAGAALGATGRAHVVVTEQRLDLTDAANRSAAAAAIAAAQGGRGGTGRSAALDARLREAAVVHVRAYAVQDGATEVGGTVGDGVLAVGGSRGRTTATARLVGAATRGLGGAWRRREDCLAA